VNFEMARLSTLFVLVCAFIAMVYASAVESTQTSVGDANQQAELEGDADEEMDADLDMDADEEVDMDDAEDADMGEEMDADEGVDADEHALLETEMYPDRLPAFNPYAGFSSPDSSLQQYPFIPTYPNDVPAAAPAAAAEAPAPVSPKNLFKKSPAPKIKPLK
jgi:hypothetical protein